MVSSDQINSISEIVLIRIAAKNSLTFYLYCVVSKRNSKSGFDHLFVVVLSYLKHMYSI